MADDDQVINSIRSYSSGVRGRSIANVRNHHIVIDEPSIGEAITPAETFLAGVSACAVGLIENVAGQRELSLSNADVKIEGFRNKSNPTYFQRVEMTFQLDGVSDDEARELVSAYQNY